MAHIHKHNQQLLKKYLRKTYTQDQLRSLLNTLPEGYGKFIVSASLYPAGYVKPIKPTVDSDQSAADEYLDYLDSRY